MTYPVVVLNYCSHVNHARVVKVIHDIWFVILRMSLTHEAHNCNIEKKISAAPFAMIWHQWYLYEPQYIPQIIHNILLCCVLLWFGTDPHPSGLLHWHWGNHSIAPVPMKQPWKIWANKSYISTMNLLTKQHKISAYFVVYSVHMLDIT